MRDITGLALRPRHLEHGFEQMFKVQHPFLMVDRAIGLEGPMILEEGAGPMDLLSGLPGLPELPG